MKNLLMIFDRAPYAGLSAQEALDATLVYGVFGQQVTILFRGDGVWQLQPGQKTAEDQKNCLDALRALPMYDITRLYAEGQSLEERNLKNLPEILAPELEIHCADPATVHQLIREADMVIRI